MAERFALSNVPQPTISLASLTPINKTPPAALANAQTSSDNSFTFVGMLTLNTALYPSPLATINCMSSAVIMRWLLVYDTP